MSLPVQIPVSCIQGDEPSSSEMCLAFLYYYPASKLDYCRSFPGWVDYQGTGTKDFVRNYLGIKSLNIR